MRSETPGSHGATLLALTLAVLLLIPFAAQGQSVPVRVRLAVPTKAVSFLAFYIAHRRAR